LTVFKASLKLLNGFETPFAGCFSLGSQFIFS
jgi:hypothetical protein